jgi:AcrR family transcriptional regulator
MVMTTTPNRRGARSREIVLDAAERVMALDGYEAATVARIVQEAGIPASSIYHYFGSKEGVLLAVLERGAVRFQAALPPSRPPPGRRVERLRALVATVAATLEQNPDFLRLLVALATQPRSADARVMVNRVRALALNRLVIELAEVFARSPEDPAMRDLARFALAAFDGAFVGWQAEPDIGLNRRLVRLPEALVAAARTD